MDLFDLLIVFCLGFGIGKTYAYYKFASLIKELADDAGIDIVGEIKKASEEDTDKVGKLVVEAHGDSLYLFERETDTFICQGKTVAELAKTANDYKHIAYAVVKYDNQLFTFQNGESKEYTV